MSVSAYVEIFCSAELTGSKHINEISREKPRLVLPKHYEIDNPQANKAVRFINSLTQVEGKWARKPFNLRPWQEHCIVRPTFGLVDENGKRKIRTVFVGIPRKNGKTAIAATMALKCLCADGEYAGQVYSAAADRGQASLVFNAAKRMVLQDPVLRDRCQVIDSQKRIVYLPTDSFYCAISADADTKHGFSASAIIVDEVHTQRNRELYDVLTTSTGAREQPLVVNITTAGYDKNSLCWELWDYAEKVRDGIFEDETFLPVLYTLPEEMNWLDESNWALVNPALGDFRGLEEMQNLAKKAQRMPALENTFRRLYLNQWTQQDIRWIPMDEWAKCARQYDESDLYGRPCWIGVDLSSTTDITAVVLVFPFDDGSYKVLPYFFVPEDDMRNRERRDRIGYQGWVKQRFLEATPGNVVDYDAVESKIKSHFADKFQIREIAFDRWNSTHMQIHCQEAGLTVVPFGQGYASMSAPAKEMEKLILSGKLNHNNHPVLNWMMSNVTREQDPAGNIKPSKRKSTEKIDGVVALVMALGRAMVRETDQGSVYDTRGILIL